jgi:hypothetical protein
VVWAENIKFGFSASMMFKITIAEEIVKEVDVWVDKKGGPSY